MADQGLLAQSKPTAATNTLLYSAPIDQSASAVLTIANDGTGSAFDVGIKDFDQLLTVDASSYLFHPGDVISGYRVEVDTAIALSDGFNGGLQLTTDDLEKTFRFESFYVPAATSVYVKDVAIRSVAFESSTGTFVVGETLSTGAAPNDTTALIYAVTDGVLYIGPSTINGGGAEFGDGDSVTSTGGAAATISAGGIGTASQTFAFSTTTAGGTYNTFIQDRFELFSDRTYRFDVSDASMSGRDFSLSTIVNGEWGPDDTIGTGDDGTEYTTGKTTNGTAGSGGAYVQYDFGSYDSVPSPLYYYDGGTGTPGNSVYGGSVEYAEISDSYTYTEIYIYDKDGTLADNVDSFTFGGTTYTINSQTSGPYGYVRSYSGTDLYVIKGSGSVDFTSTDTFQDNPKDNTVNRNLVTVSSVDVDTDGLEASNYIIQNKTNSANNNDKVTSLVIGPGERLIVESATANNVFSLIGFEDNSTAFTTRVFGS